MVRRYGTGLRALMMLVDVGTTAAIAALLSVVMFRAEGPGFWAAALGDPLLGLALYVSTWVTVLWLRGAYRLRARWSIASEAGLILNSLAWMALATFAFLYLANLPEVSRSYLFYLIALQGAATIGGRTILRLVLAAARRRGRNLRTVVVIGTGATGRAFAKKLEDRAELGLRVVGFLGDPTDDLPRRWRYLGAVDRLPEVVHRTVVDEVAICLVTEDWALVESVTALCEAEGRTVRMPVPMPRLSIATGHVEDLDGTPVLSVLTGPDAAMALMVKRTIDLVGGLAGIILLTPLFAVIALAIVMTDGRPVFFRQERVGFHGRRFQVVKFRSMVNDADAQLEHLREHNEINGHAFKMTADPRVTRVGAFLRRSSLDELPQLWNVLRGEMSLVGPRPPLPHEVEGYDAWHRRRLSMKPGMTGLWQIEGRDEPEFDQWVRKDLEYIDRWSPWLDIEIILRTIPAVLRATGR